MGTFLYVIGVVFVTALLCVLAFGLWDLGLVVQSIIEIREDEWRHQNRNNRK